MKKFWTDRIALVTAGIGIALMVLTLVWRVNPVEGSAMPSFLTGNPFGEIDEPATRVPTSAWSCACCTETH